MRLTVAPFLFLRASFLVDLLGGPCVASAMQGPNSTTTQTKPNENKPLPSSLSRALLLAALCLLSILATGTTRADDYHWINAADGNYSDRENWGNNEIPNGPAGPPTAGDNVNLGSGGHTVIVETATGAMTLSGDEGATLKLDADYSAINLTDAVTIGGPATLTALAVIGTAGPIVDGGNLDATSFSAFDLTVKNDGFASFNSINGTFGGIVEANGKVAIFDNSFNFNCAVSSGGFVHFMKNLFNTSNFSVALDGTGSTFLVEGDFSVAGSFLDITNAAALDVTNNLRLFGGLSPGGGHWGVGGVSNTGTRIAVGGNIDLGGTGGPGNFFLAVFDGVQVTCARLRIGAGSSLTLSPGAQFTAGNAGMTSGAPMPGALLATTNGSVGGSGALNGNLTIGSGGLFAPGENLGTFTVQGNYEQDAGSTYYLEIGGTDPATGFDQINVDGGAATLGGTLRVRLVNGFTPTVGQTFRIVNAASVSGAFASISPPSQAGISLTTDTFGATVKIDSVVAGAPVISSPTVAAAAPGAPFNYQITATNNPTSFSATNLPAGLTINTGAGLISGTPTAQGVFIVPITANNAAGAGAVDLTINSDPSVGAILLLNISTRLNVQTGDNVLIGGFIITGPDPKKVIVRGLGPSLGRAGVQGALADPTIELHETGGTVITNDNWKDTQQQEIIATGIPPTNDLESAIVATLDPGAYTVVLRGKNNGTGIGLIEAYDLDQTTASQLANISTRGFVERDNNVMIGGFIAGGASGASTVVVRAIGPSLGAAGVANPLQDPTLELHDSSGAIIASNDNWKDSQQAEIEATGLAPTDDRESAIEATLASGAYTAIVRGKGNTTGVGLVEAYHIQ